MTKGKVIVIVGPTASGKTALAVEIAKTLQTEVLSADARQFYHEMQIGTARPFEEELQGVKHHFLGHLSVTKSYGAGQYADDARPVLEQTLEKFGSAVIVGGSGLYIKALLEGLNELPEVPKELRDELSKSYKEKGLAWLQNEVQNRDNAGYNRMDSQNHTRLLRALELLMVSGKSLAELYESPKQQNDFYTLFIGCDWPREVLYQRINIRTQQMAEMGLVREVESLAQYRNLNALHTVGYTEIFQYLDSEISLKEALDLVAQHTRNYAKRQLTWFKNQTNAQWFQPDDLDAIMKVINSFQG